MAGAKSKGSLRSKGRDLPNQEVAVAHIRDRDASRTESVGRLEILAMYTAHVAAHVRRRETAIIWKNRRLWGPYEREIP